MRSAVVARIAVEHTAYHFDKPYDYLVPATFADIAKAGCRVMVPFGTGNRKRQGIILSLGEATELEKVKPISSVLDKEPVLSAEMLELVSWIREHTFCTWYDAVKLVLPAGINMRIVASYCMVEGVDIESVTDVTEEELNILQIIYKSRGTVEKSRLLEVCGLSEDSKLPDKLVEKGLLNRTDEAVRKIGDATIKMARLVETDGVMPKLTPKQKAVVDFLTQTYAASVKEICYFAGVTQAVITGLEKKGVVELFENIVYRTPTTSYVTENKDIILNEEQQEAYNRFCEMLNSDEGGAGLLYGVTGSGKTQVFLKLVDKAIEQQKGVIVMVPEISLTPQTLALFNSRYGGRVAIFHSAMSLGQRMDEWRRVKNGEADVAIGTRSAVFAPFDNLGLIIIDEEQEHTYQSESTPRFHARDVARFRAAYNKGLLVLASATPSLESYCAAQNGRYELCRLQNRYGNAHLPKVHTVDMRQEVKQGNLSPISRFLQERLEETLKNGEQAILLLNRRGHNTIVTCSGCGTVKSCPNCSISLTYHSANGRLMCHYCGYSEEFTDKCSECGSDRIKYSGFGTQRAEQELSILFEKARILRMDADSTMARNSYEQKLSAFAKGEYDIMLGTQMVAKGLDFSKVTLVGVLNADGSLYSEDFRSYERTFSLLTQVVGRSGRGDKEGIAVVQTVTPENEIISLAATQDYDSFYNQEIGMRRAMVYPPYCSICLVGFVGDTASDTRDGAMRYLEMLRIAGENSPHIKMIVLGPSVATVPKVSGKYRYRILIKVKNSREFREMTADLLKRFMKDPQNRNVTIFADMNSESTF